MQQDKRDFTVFVQQPLPVTEAIQILLSAHLATTNTSHSTIKVYLSAVRKLHALAGLHEHFNLQLTPGYSKV